MFARWLMDAWHDGTEDDIIFVDTAVIYCITSLCEQFFLANYCIEIRTPTSPSPSPFHSRNRPIVIEATATTPEFTIVCFSVVLNNYAY